MLWPVEIEHLDPERDDWPELPPDAAARTDLQPDEQWKADFKRRLLEAYDELYGGARTT